MNDNVPDFVRKLYRMLEDASSSQSVVWGSTGDTFIVKESAEFAKTILPNHFKHNNFASFVRQLNKYDFHKVKREDLGLRNSSNTDPVWEFQHPNFKKNRLDLLETIKRKPSAARPKNDPNSKSSFKSDDYQSQIDGLAKIQGEMTDYLQNLSRNYHILVEEMLNFKRNLTAQEQVIRAVVETLKGTDCQTEQYHSYPGHNHNQQHIHPSVPASRSVLSTAQADRLIDLLQDSSNMHGRQYADLQKRLESLAAIASKSIPGANLPTASSEGTSSSDSSNARQSQPPQPAPFSLPSSQSDSRSKSTTPPSEEDNRPSSVVKKAKVKPSWSVPPKVLLVEDDAICRKLSGKLLQIFGCSFDVAVDGVAAVNKMNLTKYDIVLMDIVMPNLDGVSATTRIRQFDQNTPIISMTSNTTANDCYVYLTHGMNDVLPKPFSQSALLEVIEKYCSHLQGLAGVSSSNPNNAGIVNFGLNFGIANNGATFGLLGASSGEVTSMNVYGLNLQPLNVPKPFGSFNSDGNDLNTTATITEIDEDQEPHHLASTSHGQAQSGRPGANPQQIDNDQNFAMNPQSAFSRVVSASTRQSTNTRFPSSLSLSVENSNSNEQAPSLGQISSLGMDNASSNAKASSSHYEGQSRPIREFSTSLPAELGGNVSFSHPQYFNSEGDSPPGTRAFYSQNTSSTYPVSGGASICDHNSNKSNEMTDPSLVGVAPAHSYTLPSSSGQHLSASDQGVPFSSYVSVGSQRANFVDSSSQSDRMGSRGTRAPQSNKNPQNSDYRSSSHMASQHLAQSNQMQQLPYQPAINLYPNKSSNNPSHPIQPSHSSYNWGVANQSNPISESTNPAKTGADSTSPPKQSQFNQMRQQSSGMVGVSGMNMPVDVNLNMGVGLQGMNMEEIALHFGNSFQREREAEGDEPDQDRVKRPRFEVGV
ncbi:HSF-type DNA-binding-domain-containing protein [Paraphysoderma sedebokerense]|nr:HSF-type DNA-binding-domain-containing protein [Paraphysoderma sedebokerense]